MMSYSTKLDRRGGKKETWPQEAEWPPTYNLSEQLLQLHQQTPILHPCYPTQFDNELFNTPLYANDFPSSSPILLGQDYSVSGPDYTSQDLYKQTKDTCAGDFFGEEIFDMEDTFRAALMQYFSQVDQEKQGMSADLRKIKEDFCKYEEESKKVKLDNIQKEKIIRKLTENGKLFVKEIERLKDELRETESHRRLVVAENNNLQKIIKYEKDAVPHLENELKNLAEENQYLKLLAEDTQKLNEQEKEIQHYSNQLEQQRQINQHQEKDLKKHDFAIKKLSQINNELCLKINELSKFKNVSKELQELQSKHRELLNENTCLETKYKQVNEQSTDLKDRLKNLDIDLNCLREENIELRENCYHFERECEDNIKLVKILESKLNNIQRDRDIDMRELKEKDEKCRKLESDNEEFTKDVSSLKNELDKYKVKADSLICEDELRTKNYDNLQRRLQDVEKQCDKLSNQNLQNQNELFEKQNTIDLFDQTEMRYKHRIDDLVSDLKEIDERSQRMELKCEQHVSREEDLQREILTHVKRQSEMEQEIAMTCTTIETLRKSNENCDQQRIKVQQELLFAQDSISTLERKIEEKDAPVSPVYCNTFEDNTNNLQYELLQQKYEEVGNQRNQLQTEVLDLREQLSYSKHPENSEFECDILRTQLEEYKTECQNQEKELSSVQSKFTSYDNEIDILQRESNQLQEKLQFFEKQSENENTFFCSSSNEWYVDLECSISNERPYQQLNSQSQFSEQMNSQSSCAHIKSENNTTDRNNITEKKHPDKNSSRLMKELNFIQKESMNKSDLIHSLQNDLATRETTIQNLTDEKTELYKDLQDISELQEAKLQTLTEEKRQLYIDLQDVVKEISCLRQNERNTDHIIDENNICIEELQDKRIQLENELSDKENLTKELETLVEDLQNELDKSVKKQHSNQEIEEYSAKLNQDLQENLHISELHVQKLQESISNRDQDIVKLQYKIKEQQDIIEQISTDQIKAERLSPSEVDYQQFLKERIETLEEALLEKEKELEANQIDVSTDCKETQHTNQSEDNKIGQVNCAQSGSHQKQLKEKINEIEKLRNENKNVNKELSNLKYSTPLHSNSETLDASFQDENIVSKQKYLDLAEQLETKKQQIIDYEEHIQLLHLNISESPSVQLDVDSQDTSGFESMRGRPEKRDSQENQNLRLPTPNKTVEAKVLHQRRSSLPPIPGRTSSNTQIQRSRCNSSDRAKDSNEKETAVTKMGKENVRNGVISSDELRNKLVKLNSELLKKKTEVSSLQEELKMSKRKLTRSEESYKNVVSKNESLEYEIIENRRKILDVQSKQNINDSYEIQHKRDVNHLKDDIQGLERSYDNLMHENGDLETKIRKKDDVCSSIQKKLDDAEQEIQHWKHNTGVLEKECQSLTTCNEKRESEIIEYQNENEELRLNLEIMEKEKDKWKKNQHSNDFQLDELNAEIESLKEEMFLKVKLNDRLKDQLNVAEQEREIYEVKVKEDMFLKAKLNDRLKDELNIAEQEREIYEVKVKENMVKLKSLERKLYASESNRKEAESENEELRINLELSEKEKDNWKKNRRSNDFQLDEINAENGTLREETLLKAKLNVRLKEQLELAEQERETSAMQVNENLVRIKSLEEVLTENESERKKMESENEELRVHLERSQRQNDGWKKNRRSNSFQLDELYAENESLREDVLLKGKLNDRLKEQLELAEQKRETSEIKVKENVIRMKSLERKLSGNEYNRNEIESENEILALMVHGKERKEKDLQSENDEAVQNSRYLEKKIDDLKKIIKQKDERLSKHLHDSNDEQIIQLTDELKFSNLEVKRTSKQLKKELDNITRLEKLNSEMNKENKRLMHELIKLQDRLKNLSEENEMRREKITKAEKEQKQLDNLLTKTQNSNSEFLDKNKSTVEELRTMKNKVNQLVQELEDKGEQQKELERKIHLTENELHVSTEKLSTENKDLTREVHDSRRIIRELEAILDQGQLDFDEMDIQLEKLRYENIDLDKKLHEVLKQQIQLQSENEDLNRKLTTCMDEIESLKAQIENEKKEYEICLKEKDEIEGQLQECKTREEYFEERLRSAEKTLKAKEDLFENEKKEKEKMQDDILRLQSELIECKTKSEHLRNDHDAKNRILSDKMHILQVLEISQSNLETEKDDLELKLSDKLNILNEYERKVTVCNEERDEMEFKFQECLNQIQSLESMLEDETLSKQNEKEELLTTISSLKRTLNEKDILNEKYTYQQITVDSDMKHAVEQNEKLMEQIRILQDENVNVKQTMSATINELQEKVHHTEYAKSQEMIHLKATMDALENSRGNDISLLRMKLQEVEDLRRKMNEDKREQADRDNEIEALKEDIIQLQTELDKAEANNTELSKSIEQHKSHIQYLEQNKHEIDDDKRKLIDSMKNKEVSLKFLEKQSEVEHQEKEYLLSEKNGLKATYEQMLKEKDNKCTQLDAEILALRDRVHTIEGIKEENENLKSDLEAILSERKGFQTKLSEYTQLRTENYDLRAKADRNQELLNENRMIKQELRDAESKHLDNLDKTNRENTALRRNVDELFKKNQDLELNNVTYVKTRPRSTVYFEPTTPRLDPVTLTIKPKSASVDNIHEVGFEMESFSPMKNGVATSTPTQESNRFTSSIITRAQSADRINTIKTVKIPPIVAHNIAQKINNTSFEDNGDKPLSNRDNQLASGPLVQVLGRSIQTVDEPIKRKVDASWNQPKQDEYLQSSIKLNPFFQMDQNVPKSNWKTAVNATKPNPSRQLSPVKSSSQLDVSTSAYPFDMRPKSTDIPEQKPNVSSVKADTIGNEFVNRLKATFERR